MGKNTTDKNKFYWAPTLKRGKEKPNKFMKEWKESVWND
jgi:hypothetical protein